MNSRMRLDAKMRNAHMHENDANVQELTLKLKICNDSAKKLDGNQKFQFFPYFIDNLSEKILQIGACD